MSAGVQELPGSGTFERGVHPDDRKSLSAEQPIEVLPVPQQVNIPLLQHTGAPCAATVKMKAEVDVGDVLGTSDAFISAPVHASIKGVCGKEAVATLPNARHVHTIPVKAAEEQPSLGEVKEGLFGGEWPVSGLDAHSPEAVTQAVKEAGVVGQGGAAFPTYVKLLRNEKKPVDTILVNGCECEPYLTSDYRLMVEAAAPVITGSLLAAQAAGAKQILIAVEDNKPAAVEALKKAAQGTNVQVAALKTKYPMGGEKQTVRAALNRTIPTGGLPLDVGVVVINVATAAAIARAVLRGKPLTHRVVSVTGAGIKNPKNLLVPIGTAYSELIDYCGGLTDDCARVIAGGPMMGFALSDFSSPVTKGTSGIVALSKEDVKKAEETTCVRCGRCVDACPLNLVPTKLALASRNQAWDLAERYHLMACMECGCCAYVCPASLPLVQLMRMGKAQVRKLQSV